MLDNQTAVVTGAAQGIGRQIALTFAENGANVVVADIQSEGPDGEDPTHEVIDAGDTQGEFVETDVTESDAVFELFEQVDDEFESLDILVNNAGVHTSDASVLELEQDVWKRILDVNLTGTYLCTKAALPQLLDDDDGCIVNISSVAGVKGSEGVPAYCSSKAGVANLTRQLAVDYGGHGLRVNSVMPGLITTEMTDAFIETEKGRRMLSGISSDRTGDPEEVAKAVLFLASDLASYVNGHALVVDGGLTARYY
jgi:NAD(P)-dependent dehydrogenase (short-subunit alcohol dehydrogenase family)